MMRIFIFLILWVILLPSCDFRDNRLEQINSLPFSDTLVIDFENLPMPNEKSSSGTHEGRFYFTFNFLDSMGLYFYDFVSEKWESNFFQKQGPNGIIKDGPFLIINDSLAFHPLIGLSGFQLVNYQARQVQNFKFPDNRFEVGKISDKSIHFDGRFIRFPVSFSKSNWDEDYVSEVPIYGVFDTYSSNFTSLMKYPEELFGGTYSLNFLSKTFLVVNDHIYLNMAKSHEIYKYDLGLNLVEEITLQSQNVDVSNPGLLNDQILNMMNSKLGGEYSSLFESDGFLYRTVSYLPNSSNNSVENLNGYIEVLETLRFEILKFSLSTKVISRYDYSGSPTSKGIGDGLVLKKNSNLYFWLFDKVEDGKEKFVSLSNISG
ncbi:DUF4221 domain-containing protein [Algoriphagus kandeliae]|uniref:DUF4221 domain-containing protein n=1 Tax=Algoriphagus kandeliae TaxID=2562278 RepID=A0A4Y9QUH6_9BACT|nr:DUF4221 family protein [Algoriphagus kandeliae]TFV96264.1 DUF4221 domain-containing protein [Algoriphagus kandeliae]